jgi:hypothetical protein
MHKILLFILLSFASGITAAQPLTSSSLKNGDLLFQVNSRTDFTAAIADVTRGSDSLDISHVAIVCRSKEQLYALEADCDSGVWMNPIDSFLKHSAQYRHHPMVLVGRLKSTNLADRCVHRAMRYIGRPYDFLFAGNDSAIYCSELVYLSYLDKRGKHLFHSHPMSFHDASGTITPYWRNYYAKRKSQVPEGMAGTNPSDMSRDKAITIIGRLY